MNLSPEARSLAAVVAVVIVLWFTEALPLAVTALLGAAACVLLGVARPPIEAAKATQSISPVAKAGAGRRPVRVPASSMAVSMPATIATIIAAVTVLEMKALIKADTTATAARIRRGRSPTHGTASTA